MSSQLLRDSRGRFTSRGVHDVVGHKPHIPLTKLIDSVRDVEHFLVDLQAHANLNRDGAKALVHHALAEEAAYAGGLDWGQMLSGAQKVFGVAKAVAPHALAAYQAARATSGGAFSLREVLQKSRNFARHVAKMAKQYVQHAPHLAEYAATFGKRGEKLSKHVKNSAQRAQSLGELITKIVPEQAVAQADAQDVAPAVQEALEGSGLMLGGYPLGGQMIGGLMIGGAHQRRRRR